MFSYSKLISGIYFIAEMSANHAGSLDNALEIVRAAAKAGADCLKIQTYTADTITLDCGNEYFRIKGGLWNGNKLYDLYDEASTPWEWHEAIRDECKKAGLDFLSTPFDKTAVDFLESLDVEFYKIASFELVDIPLIEYAASKGKPMVISCGMGSIEEIQDALDACRRQGNNQIVLLKCCSEYPANFKDMNLAIIPDMKERFGVPVGLSDHSMGSLAAVVGVSLGACVIEKHFCLSRSIKNPDSEFSMESEEFAQMVSDCKAVLDIRGQVSYDLTDAEKASKAFRKSIFAVRDIKAGEAFTEENIRVIRPGYGASPKFYKQLPGTVSKREYKRGEPVTIHEPYLRPATKEDTDLLFRWVNDAAVRENAFNTKKIEYDEHIKWFTERLASPDCVIYIYYKENDEPAGQGRIDADGSDGIISYSIAGEYRLRGHGGMLLRLLEKAVINDMPGIDNLVAYVKKENTVSQRKFEQLGYQKTEEENRLTYTKSLRRN